MRGTVTAFDREVGLGEILRDDGWIVPFHCIVIADGSRDIPVGVDVEFDLICKLGRYEAAHVVSI
ncbi:MAG: cold shock domain-containing protein [Ilumatobacteraceae bacterium]